MSPKGRPEGESAPKHEVRRVSLVDPKGRPEGESAARRLAGVALVWMWLALASFVLAPATTQAQVRAPAPAATPADPALDARLKRLEGELRCLVCQNQSLADSDAPLAEDLRREVRGLAVQGKSDSDIKDFLVARYGDFVLYRPPVKSTTWLLWFGPFALLLGGALVWWLVSRRRPRRDGVLAAGPGAPASPETGLAKARALLDNPLD